MLIYIKNQQALLFAPCDGNDVQKWTLDGSSLLPLMSRPDSAAAGQNATYALSQFPRCVDPNADPEGFWEFNNCMLQDRSMFSHMGYSIRTHTWRFTEWYRWNGASLTPDWSDAVGAEP